MTSHPLPCLHKLGIVFILFCLCSCFPNYSFFFRVGRIHFPVIMLPKKSWMKRNVFFFCLYILFNFGYLWHFGWKLFSLRILKVLFQLLSTFYFVFMKPSVTLMNNPAHGIYFFSLEVFRVFALFLKYRNFIQKINFFFSHLLFWTLNGIFQSWKHIPYVIFFSLNASSCNELKNKGACLMENYFCFSRTLMVNVYRA